MVAPLTTAPSVGVAQQSAELAIVGGFLIDGNGGPPLENSVVLVQGHRITHVGTVADTEIPRGARVIQVDGYTVMPGLHDLHVHLIGATHGVYSEFFPRYRDRYREIALISAKQLISAGVTSARDLGMPLNDAVAVKRAIESGSSPGPRMFMSGPFLQKSFEEHWGDIRWAVNGADDARAKTRRIIEAGMDVIKVIQLTELTSAERSAIADEARKAGKPIVVHAGDIPSIRAAAEMGVRTVEHIGGGGASQLDEEYVKLMRAAGMIAVPTSIVSKVYNLTEMYPERLDDQRLRNDLPPDLYRDIRDSWRFFSRLDYFDGAYYNRHHPTKIMQLYDAGVAVMVGTDAGTPMNFHYEATLREMELLVEYGIEPMRVLLAATKEPPRVYGMSHELGTIEPGKLADIIVVNGNPLRHMSAIEQNNVIYVFKGGVQYKGPGTASAPER